jgi:hypothetical protein
MENIERKLDDTMNMLREFFGKGPKENPVSTLKNLIASTEEKDP